MNSNDLIRKIKSYPIASTAFGLSIILLVAVYVRGKGQDEMRGVYDDANRRWDKMDVNVFKNSVNLETHLEKAEIISEDVKSRFIRSSELAKNYQYFYRLEASTGVRIATLQQQPTAPRPPVQAGRAAAKPAAEPSFLKVGYTMTVTGDFRQTLDLLGALEHGQHFYHLKDFTLQRATGNDTRDITITMNFDLLGTP